MWTSPRGIPKPEVQYQDWVGFVAADAVDHVAPLEELFARAGFKFMDCHVISYSVYFGEFGSPPSVWVQVAPREVVGHSVDEVRAAYLAKGRSLPTVSFELPLKSRDEFFSLFRRIHLVLRASDDQIPAASFRIVKPKGSRRTKTKR